MGLQNTWHNIKNQCNNRTGKFFEKFGGRDGYFYPEWRESFQAFRDWTIENGYVDGAKLVRKDKKKGYTPENCVCRLHLRYGESSE